MPKQKTDRETFTKRIDTDLSEEEIDQRLKKLVEVTKHLFSTKAAKSEQLQEYNAELKATRETQKNLIAAIETGKDTEEIEVYERTLEDRDVVQIIRTDTEEIIEERPMTVDERQGKLPLDGAANDQEEDEDLPSTTVAVNGERVEGEILDTNFPPGKAAPRGRRPRVH